VKKRRGGTMTQITAPAHDGVSVEGVDRAEVERNVDLLAHRFLDMSGAEFMVIRQRGKLEELGDSAAVNRVLSAASLLD
jgi:hypothetical protein